MKRLLGGGDRLIESGGGEGVLSGFFFVSYFVFLSFFFLPTLSPSFLFLSHLLISSVCLFQKQGKGGGIP